MQELFSIMSNNPTTTATIVVILLIASLSINGYFIKQWFSNREKKDDSLDERLKTMEKDISMSKETDLKILGMLNEHAKILEVLNDPARTKEYQQYLIKITSLESAVDTLTDTVKELTKTLNSFKEHIPRNYMAKKDCVEKVKNCSKVISERLDRIEDRLDEKFK